MEYAVGEVVEVVANPQSVERINAAPRWVRTRIERPTGVGFNGKAKVYVRVDGMLVTRQLKYVRKGQ